MVLNSDICPRFRMKIKQKPNVLKSITHVF